MKMKWIICCAAALYAADGHAQFGRLGSVTSEEEMIKTCPFDAEASAVILLDEGVANSDGNEQLVEYHHRRTKILSEKGMDQANVSIHFYAQDGYESISGIEAVTINTDDGGHHSMIPIDRKSIFTTRINKYYSKVTFAFPGARVGSILEYIYTSTKKSVWGLRNWTFQDRLPVYKSSFRFSPAPRLEFTYAVQKNKDYPIVIKPSKNEGDMVYFEMDSIPGLADEPYMDAREDYIQQVRFTVTKYAGSFGVQKYMTTWNEVARELWMNSSFGGEERVGVKEAQEAASLAVAGKDEFGKMSAIYRLVGNSVNWNGITSRSADEGVRNAWNKKSGNSGCINLLLVNLLRDAGLNVYPLLVSERGNGKINTETPFLDQFNTVYAAVKIADKMYYLDATYPATPPDMIPSSILNTTAVLLDKSKGRVVEITENEIRFQERIYFNGQLDANGKLTADVSKTCKGYSRVENASRYRKDKSNFVNQYIKNGLANITIDSLQVQGDDSDTLNFVEHFKINTAISKTGDYAFLDLNLFTGFEKNPFILKQRFSNINFGYKKSIYLNFVSVVPAGWTIDAMPKSIRLLNADQSVVFSREMFFEKEASRLTARIKIDLNKSQYSVDEYPEVKEFFQKMADLLNEQVVFKITQPHE